MKLVDTESVLKLNGGFKTCSTEIFPTLFKNMLSEITTDDLFQPKSKDKGSCNALKIVLLITTLFESIFFIRIPIPSKFFLPINSILFFSPCIVTLPSQTISPASAISIFAPGNTSNAPVTRTTSLIT